METRIKEALIRAFEKIQEQSDYLSAVDAETGDGDHGITMSKIATVVCETLRAGGSAESLQKAIWDTSGAVMKINGGSAIPLWTMMLDGMGEAAENAGSVSDQELFGALLEGAVAGLAEISSAKPGEKTMLDVLLPVAAAAKDMSGEDEKPFFAAMAAAAKEAAEKTKEMQAVYGRAKDMHEGSKGHYDPGALSMSMILQGICVAYTQE